MRFVALAALLTASLLSRGQTMLKLQGSSFAPIRQKSIKAEMTFDGDFAKTKLSLTFYNPSFNQREADFLYTVPDGALITSFAYWFRNERVDAQIVERERAEVIYEAIRVVRRDPALVEMVGKNLFRARIFPVEERADLRIEMTMVSVAKNGSFVIPMAMDKGKPLESAEVTVRGRTSSTVTNVTNNYGLPSSFANGTYALTLTQGKWRPEKDLKIGFQKGFDASLSSARSGGGLGFFALNITSDRNVSDVKVSISGVKVSDLHNASIKTLKKGETLCVTGRYQGSGPAIVKLRSAGVTSTQNVVFSSANAANNLATKLWAADVIDSCGKNPKLARLSRETSLRYTLPSPYTSWLAIPQAERKNFATAIKTANAVVLGRRQAEAVRKGKGYLAALKTLRSQLNTSDKQILDAGKQEVDQAYDWRLSRKADRLGLVWRDRIAHNQALGDQERREMKALDADYALLDRNMQASLFHVRDATVPIRTDLKNRLMAGSITDDQARAVISRLSRWEKVSRTTGRDYYDIVELFRSEDQAFEKEILQNGEPSQASQQRRERVREVKKLLGIDPYQNEGWHVRQTVNELAHKIALSELDNNPEAGKAARERITVIAKWVPNVNADATISGIRSNIANTRAYEDARTLIEIVRKRGDDNDEARALRQRIEVNRKIGGSDKNSEFWRNLPIYGVGEDIEQLVQQGKSFTEITSALDQQRTRLRRAGFKDGPGLIDEAMQHKYEGALWALGFEKERPNPDEALLQKEDTLLRSLGALLRKDFEKDIHEAMTEARWRPAARWEYLKELRKPNPDPDVLMEYRNIMIDDSWRGQEYVDLQVERIATDVMIDKLEKEQRTPEIEKQIADLTKKVEALRARMGDPIAYAALPKNAIRVTATFPWGESKMAVWDEAKGCWSVKFDVPAYAREGQQDVVFRGTSADGSEVRETWQFTVDLTAPTLTATAVWWQGKLVIEASGSEDLARVKAVLADRDPLDLDHIASGRWSLSVEPGTLRQITLVAFDKAHNRTELVVHVPPRP